MQSKRNLKGEGYGSVGKPTYAPRAMSMRIFEIAAQLPKERQEEFDEFDRSKSPRKNAPKVYPLDGIEGRTWRDLPLSFIPEYCRQLGIGVPDLFRDLGLVLEYPNAKAREMEPLIASLPENKQDKLRQIMRQLAPDYWLPWHDGYGFSTGGGWKWDKANSKSGYSVRERVIVAMRNVAQWRAPLSKEFTTLEVPDRLKAEIGGDPTWEKIFSVPVIIRESIARSVPVDAAVKASKLMDISPAWLLGWVDEEHAVIASTPFAEFILTGYLAMQGENRRCFEQALAALVEGV